MKKLFGQFTCLVLLASCNVNDFAGHVSSKLSGIKGSGVSIPVSNPMTKDPVNKDKKADETAKEDSSNLTDNQFSSCMAQAANNEDSIIKISKSEKIDLTISEKSIELIGKDLQSSKLKNGKITAENFWTSISTSTQDLLNDDLIKAYSRLSSEDFEVKKKQLAYSLLFFFEHGEMGKAYQFSFDGAEVVNENISFAGSADLKEMIKVGVCADFKIADVRIVKPVVEVAKIQCAGDNRRVLMTFNSDDEFVLKVSSTKNEYDYKFDRNDVEFLSRNSRNTISYDLGLSDSPEFKIELSKDGNFLEKLKLKKNRASKLVLKNLKCKTFKNFDFE